MTECEQEFGFREFSSPVAEGEHLFAPPPVADGPTATINKFGSFKPGSLVTYKLGKTPPWPAVVVADHQIPPEVLMRRPKKPIRNIVIQFFQSRDFYWVAATQLRPLEMDHAHKQAAASKVKSKSMNKKLMQAYNEALGYVAKLELDDSDSDSEVDEERAVVDRYVSMGEERTISSVMTIDSLLSPRITKTEHKRKRHSLEPENYFEENMARMTKMIKTGGDPPLTPPISLSDTSAAAAAAPAGIDQSVISLSQVVYEDHEDEEVEYESIAVGALECIKTQVFEPIVVRARGLKLSKEEPQESLSIRKKQKKGEKSVDIVVDCGPVKLDAESASDLNDHLDKLRLLVPVRNATDATNIMKLVENYRLMETLTELRNHAIRGDVVAADAARLPDLAERCDELVKFWWAAQHIPEFQ